MNIELIPDRVGFVVHASDFSPGSVTYRLEHGNWNMVVRFISGVQLAGFLILTIERAWNREYVSNFFMRDTWKCMDEKGVLFRSESPYYVA